MSNKELKLLMKYWQKELGLQGWDIKIEFVQASAMEYPAHNSFDVFHKRSIISIVRSDVQNESSISYRGTEHLVVHELLHLTLYAWSASSGLEEVHQEQAINQVVEALLRRR